MTEVRIDVNEAYISFYSDFLNDSSKAENLVKLTYDLTDIDVRPRRILNNIARLISIADDQLKVRGGRHGLQIFFWMVCIEAISNIVKPSSRERDKIKIIRNFFVNSVEIEDQQFLLDHIKRSIVDYRWKYVKRLHINIIANIFYFIRHDFVHEGEYSNFHFSDSNDWTCMNSLSLKEFPDDVYEKRIYDVTITLEQMRSIVIRGCINFLKSQLKQYYSLEQIQ